MRARRALLLPLPLLPLLLPLLLPPPLLSRAAARRAGCACWSARAPFAGCRALAGPVAAAGSGVAGAPRSHTQCGGAADAGRRRGRRLAARVDVRVEARAAGAEARLEGAAGGRRLAPLPPALRRALAGLDAGSALRLAFSPAGSASDAASQRNSMERVDEIMLPPLRKCLDDDLGNIAVQLKECLGARLLSVRAVFVPGAEADATGLALHHLRALGVEELHLEGARWREPAAWQLPQLRALAIERVALGPLSPDWFNGLLNLERLRFSFNDFEVLPVALSALKKLKGLDISHNSITFGGDSLKSVLKMHELEQLVLSGTYLNSLLNIIPILKGFSNETRPMFLLSYLDISNCNISFIGEDEAAVFSQQSRLSFLNMSHNNIKFIPNNMFEFMKSLQFLDLSHNCLTSSTIRLESTYLKVLNLSWNKLSSPVFIAECKIELLNLAHNEISQWDYDFVFTKENTLNVSIMNLSYNNIKTVSKSMLGIFASLRAIDLGANPLHCDDCNMKYMKDWLFNNHTTVVYNVGTTLQLKCFLGEGSGSVEVHGEDCDKESQRIHFAVIVIAITSTAIASFLLVLIIVCIGKKYEISYAMHLLRLKKESKNPNNGGHEYDAFIIYCAADGAWAERELRAPLEARGLRLCALQRDFPLGSSSLDNFSTALCASGCVVVVLSRCFLEEQWALWQLEHAARRPRRLVLLERGRAARALAPRHVRFLMDTRTCLQWARGGRAADDELRRLAAALAPRRYPH